MMVLESTVVAIITSLGASYMISGTGEYLRSDFITVN